VGKISKKDLRADIVAKLACESGANKAEAAPGRKLR
jgi:hypothetical protein